MRGTSGERLAKAGEALGHAAVPLCGAEAAAQAFRRAVLYGADFTEKMSIRIVRDEPPRTRRRGASRAGPSLVRSPGQSTNPYRRARRCDRIVTVALDRAPAGGRARGASARRTA